MKKFCYLALVALVAVAFSSCSMFGGSKEGNDPEFRTSDLWGKWHRTNSEEGDDEYIRFTDEESDEEGLLLGLEWNEGDDKYEDDYLTAREELGHPGSGWFKYKLSDNRELIMIELMDISTAEIFKTYVITKLTSTELNYHEKGMTSNTFVFEKVREDK